MVIKAFNFIKGVCAIIAFFAGFIIIANNFFTFIFPGLIGMIISIAGLLVLWRLVEGGPNKEWI